MASEGRKCPEVVRLTSSAPTNTPGQTCRPKSSSPANATPDAGQTGDALGLTTAKSRPSLPATKYATAKIASAATTLGSRLCRSRPDPLLLDRVAIVDQLLLLGVPMHHRTPLRSRKAGDGDPASAWGAVAGGRRPPSLACGGRSNANERSTLLNREIRYDLADVLGIFGQLDRMIPFGL